MYFVDWKPLKVGNRVRYRSVNLPFRLEKKTAYFLKKIPRNNTKTSTVIFFPKIDRFSLCSGNGLYSLVRLKLLLHQVA